MFELHFSYGGKIRTEWQLWTKSPLVEQFESNGIYWPDDMSSLILDLYWKHLNDIALDLEDSVALLKKEYDELIATIDTSKVDFSVGDKIPPPDPAKVQDRLIRLDSCCNRN